MIRSVKLEDASDIVNIYNYYIKNTIITMEEEIIDDEEMKKRIKYYSEEKNLPWIVMEENKHVIGYAYSCPWKSRSAYRYSVESSVYVSNEWKGKGTGSKLYEALFEILKKDHGNIHAVLAGIALPNPVSVGFHEKFGFSKVGQLKEVGFKFEKWIDVGYWQKTL